jgi:predicted glycosyltransferase
MGGYNTICEVLSFEKRALIVPRVNSRGEQLIRVERLRNMGIIDVIYPNELTPQALTDWLARDMKPPQVRDRIDLNGLVRLPHLLEDVLTAPPHPARSQFHKGGILHVD